MLDKASKLYRKLGITDESLFIRAQLAKREGQYQLALACGKKVLKAGHENGDLEYQAEAWHEMGLVQRKLRAEDKALAYFTQASALR